MNDAFAQVHAIRAATGLGLREANDARLRYGSAEAAIQALKKPAARDAYETEYDRLRAVNRELLEALQAFVVLDAVNPDLWHFEAAFEAAREAIKKATGERL